MGLPQAKDDASDDPGARLHPLPEKPGKRELEMRQEPNRLRRALKILGPGLITGASDDDPSGIGTYATAGASLGYSIMWSMLFTFPLMASVQYICAKVGLASGMGLASALRRYYPKAVLYPALAGLVIANTINAGTDIGAIAAGVTLLAPIPAVITVVLVTLAITGLLIWGSYDLIASVFKWLTLVLFAYVASAILAHPDLGTVLSDTFIPKVAWSTGFLTTLLAVLGTTISPYLFFWQTSQEVEEERVDLGRRRLWQRRGTSNAELRYAAWDVNVGMFISNLVGYFIIMATSAALFTTGHTNIQSAAEAAQALRPVAGDAAYWLFALGLIGTGFLAVPVLVAASAYAVSEAFQWRYGLDQKLARAKQFYALIVASMLIGMAIDFLGINPITALFWTAVINGFLAPPLLVLIMLIANNRQIMGERTNGRVMNILGWLTTGIMFAAAIGMIVTWGK